MSWTYLDGPLVAKCLELDLGSGRAGTVVGILACEILELLLITGDLLLEGGAACKR